MQPSSSTRATIVSAENQNGATIVKATFFFCHYNIVWESNNAGEARGQSWSESLKSRWIPGGSCGYTSATKRKHFAALSSPRPCWRWLQLQPSCGSPQWHWVTLVMMVHYDVIKWKHFPRYYPFVRGTHRPNPRLVVIWDAITVIWRHRNVILRNMKNLHVQYFFNYWRRNRPGYLQRWYWLSHIVMYHLQH